VYHITLGQKVKSQGQKLQKPIKADPVAIGVGTRRPVGLGPLTFLFEGPNMTVAPTFEKCCPIFELKVTPIRR